MQIKHLSWIIIELVLWYMRSLAIYFSCYIENLIKMLYIIEGENCNYSLLYIKSYFKFFNYIKHFY